MDIKMASQNHRRLDRLRNRLFRGRSKKTSKLRITCLCEGNSPVTGEVNNLEPGDLRHYRVHYDVTVMHAWGNTFPNHRNITAHDRGYSLLSNITLECDVWKNDVLSFEKPIISRNWAQHRLSDSITHIMAVICWFVILRRGFYFSNFRFRLVIDAESIT